MNGLPAQRGNPQTPRQIESDWTARFALAGAAAFSVMLLVLGFIVFRSLPQVSGVSQSVAVLAAKTDRIATGQEVLADELTRLGDGLRLDRAERTREGGEVALLRAKVGEIDSAVTALRERAEKPDERPQDPAIAELRQRLESLQHKVEQLAAAPAKAPERVAPIAAAVQAAPVMPTVTADDIEREVRDMQAVIRERQRRLTPSASGPRAAGPAPRPAAPSPAYGGSTIADPLAPMTSKTPPRVAPVRPGTLVSMSEPSAVVTRERQPEKAQTQGEPGPRVTRVGVNTAQQSMGLLGLPFDAIGNLFVAIGEGLDRLFTGREYLPRPTPTDQPATARLDR